MYKNGTIYTVPARLLKGPASHIGTIPNSVGRLPITRRKALPAPLAG